MSDFKTELESIKKKINEKMIEQAKFEQQLEDVTKIKKELDEKMIELGSNDVPSLKEEVEKLKAELTERFEKCQKMLA